MYDDNTVILLDDVLAALDAHVAQAVMENIVLKELAGRTRVLVTNQLQVWKTCTTLRLELRLTVCVCVLIAGCQQAC